MRKLSIKKSALFTSVIMLITGCAFNDVTKDSFTGKVVLDNDFVCITVIDNDSRAITVTKEYTKEDWAYNTTTVSFEDSSDTTAFYAKDSSINVKCKKEGKYTFISTAYKSDKTTAIAKTLPEEKAVTFKNNDFSLTLSYTDIYTYEEVVGVNGTVSNQWEERTAQLSSNFFSSDPWYRNNVKKIRFVKEPYTGEYSNKWSGGTNVEVYYDKVNSIMTVTSNGLKMYAPSDCFNLFSNCENLESIDFSNFDTSNVTSMRYMFEYCPKLKELDLRGFDTSNLLDMRYMFSLHGVEVINISSFNTSKVTKMAGLFSGCYALKTVDMSGIDTSNVTDMSKMFAMCYVLPYVDLQNFNTSKVTNMESMFDNCFCIENLDFSSFDTSKVTSMKRMFARCDKFTQIDLSSFDTHNVKSSEMMFYPYGDDITIKIDNNKWNLTKEQITNQPSSIIFN